MKKTQNSYKVDHAARKIIISKDFARKASTIDSPEYDDLKQLREDFPNYKVKPKKNTLNPNKDTFKKLTYDVMRCFIATRYENDNEQQGFLQQFDKILEFSKNQPGPYAYVKKWFLQNYPNYRDYHPMMKETEQIQSLAAAS